MQLSKKDCIPLLPIGRLAGSYATSKLVFVKVQMTSLHLIPIEAQCLPACKAKPPYQV